VVAVVFIAQHRRTLKFPRSRYRARKFAVGSIAWPLACLLIVGALPAAARRLTAFVWFRIEPGRSDEFEAAVASAVVPWEETAGIRSSTRKFLVDDGWDYLRFLAFDSLAEYQEYWTRWDEVADDAGLAQLIDSRRQAIVAPIPEVSIR